MSNPFTDSSNSSKVTVNHKKPNIFGNITIGISDFPNLQNEISSLITGTSALNTNSGNVIINTTPAPTINQSLVAVNPGLATWQTIDHNNLNHIGNNSHAAIDSLISSKNSASGLCPLDSTSKVPISNLTILHNSGISVSRM